MDSKIHTLVIDQGTHASRCIIFDRQGELLVAVSRKVDLICHSATEIEQDAKAILASIHDCLHELPAALLQQLGQVALTGQRSTFLAWHKQSLQAVTPAISWQDTRSKDLLVPYQTHHKQLRSITGLPLSAHYGAGKMRYLLQQYPELQSPQYLLGPLMGFLLDNLLARPLHGVDHSNAQRSLLLDVRRRQWSRTCLDLFGIDESLLPQCYPVVFDYGMLESLAVPVRAVCGDQNAALFSHGQPDAQAAYINVGTGAFVLAVTEQPVITESLLCSLLMSSEDAALYGLEATVNGAGAALSWLQKKYPRDDIEQKLDEWMDDILQPPVFINTVGGLGNPWWLTAEAFFMGDESRPEACYVAVIESIVFMLFSNLQLMMQHTSLNKIYISGGLSRYRGLCQKLADLSGLEVYRSDNHEATARGAAWLAAGQPELWHQEKRESFVPQQNDHLSRRCEIFCEALQQLKQKQLHSGNQ